MLCSREVRNVALMLYASHQYVCVCVSHVNKKKGGGGGGRRGIKMGKFYPFAKRSKNSRVWDRLLREYSTKKEDERAEVKPPTFSRGEENFFLRRRTLSRRRMALFLIYMIINLLLFLTSCQQQHHHHHHRHFLCALSVVVLGPRKFSQFLVLRSLVGVCVIIFFS